MRSTGLAGSMRTLKSGHASYCNNPAGQCPTGRIERIIAASAMAAGRVLPSVRAGFSRAVRRGKILGKPAILKSTEPDRAIAGFQRGRPCRVDDPGGSRVALAPATSNGASRSGAFGQWLQLQCLAAELEIGIICVGLDLEIEALHEFQHRAILGQYQTVDFRQAFVAGHVHDRQHQT